MADDDPNENFFCDLSLNEDDVVDFKKANKTNYVSQKHTAKKDEPLVRVCFLIKHDQWFLVKTDELKSKVGASITRLQDAMVSKAAYLYATKDYSASLKCWMELYEVKSAKEVKLEDLDGIARCHLMLHDLEQSSIWVNKMVLKFPTDPSVWLFKGNLAEKMGAPKLNQLYCWLRCLGTEFPMTEAYIGAIHIYKSFGNVPVVKYLTWLLNVHIRHNSNPLINANFRAAIISFNEWSARQPEKHLQEYFDQSIEKMSSEQKCEGLEELETELFGHAYSKAVSYCLKPDASSSVSDLESEMTDIRDPSKM